MTVRTAAGVVSKFTLTDAAFLFYIGSDDDSLSVSSTERSYNAVVSALLVASAHNFKVAARTGTDGRSLSTLIVEA